MTKSNKPIISTWGIVALGAVVIAVVATYEFYEVVVKPVVAVEGDIGDIWNGFTGLFKWIP